jgi:hypothetical protein
LAWRRPGAGAWDEVSVARPALAAPVPQAKRRIYINQIRNMAKVEGQLADIKPSPPM